MGRIAKILSFLRVTRRNVNLTDVKINQNGGNNITCEHFSDIGDDSYPLVTDYVYVSPTDRSGGNVAIGYLDPLTTKKANAGDKRIYARNSNGIVVCEIWLKNNSTILITNGNGTMELLESGEFNFNGARITPNGDVISASGVSLQKHPHSQGQDSDGDSQVPTNPPTATE